MKDLKSQPGKPGKPGGLNAEIQSRIGHQLRAMYDDVVNQGVPDRFAMLAQTGVLDRYLLAKLGEYVQTMQDQLDKASANRRARIRTGWNATASTTAATTAIVVSLLPTNRLPAATKAA